jgi:hypothetical protein
MIRSRVVRKPFIDLKQSQGNSFYIIGVGKSLLKDLNKKGINEYLDTNSNTLKQLPSEKELVSEFMRSDYNNLINTFDKYFGQYCDLEK